MIRWEQKESQRKSYRMEYDNWHRKEKELLLEQKALLEKADYPGPMNIVKNSLMKINLSNGKRFTNKAKYSLIC